MLEWPWRYRSRSKVVVHDTPLHASDHLCLIWKESIQNCRRYRADTACGTDGRTDGWTDGRTEWNQYTPQQLRWAGGIMSNKENMTQGFRVQISPTQEIIVEYFNHVFFIFHNKLASPFSSGRFNCIAEPGTSICWRDNAMNKIALLPLMSHSYSDHAALR